LNLFFNFILHHFISFYFYIKFGSHFVNCFFFFWFWSFFEINFVFLVSSFNIELLKIEFHIFFFMWWFQSHALGERYEMLTQININLIFIFFLHHFFFRFHPSTLSLLKIELFYFFLFAFYEDGSTSQPDSRVCHANSNWFEIFFVFFPLTLGCLGIHLHNCFFDNCSFSASHRYHGFTLDSIQLLLWLFFII
jgi:hypothetical protein